MTTQLGKAYFHIHNGGITFEVEDREDGAFLVIRSGHFGVQTNQMVLPINPVQLRRLGAFLKDAADQPMHAHTGYLANLLSLKVELPYLDEKSAA